MFIIILMHSNIYTQYQHLCCISQEQYKCTIFMFAMFTVHVVCHSFSFFSPSESQLLLLSLLLLKLDLTQRFFLHTYIPKHISFLAARYYRCTSEVENFYVLCFPTTILIFIDIFFHSLDKILYNLNQLMISSHSALNRSIYYRLLYFNFYTFMCCGGAAGSFFPKSISFLKNCTESITELVSV